MVVGLASLGPPYAFAKRERDHFPIFRRLSMQAFTLSKGAAA